MTATTIEDLAERIEVLTNAPPQDEQDRAGEHAGPPPLGDDVLREVETFLARFVSYPSDHALTAHVLWIAHAHLMDAWESTPRLAFLSPEPGSGKTRALEITALLVPQPVEAVNMSAAALFRIVAGGDTLPTILYDEIDTIFGKRTAEQHEDVRGLLNAGHRRGAKTYRVAMKGKEAIVEQYEPFAAVALAGLGDLPDTILTRSIVARMRRRAAGERVEPYRRRIHADKGHKLRDALAVWAASVVETVTGAWPDMPAGIEDRDADVWEPLLAVADAAGDDWPAKVRAASVALVAVSKETTPSLGIRLLSDIRTIFHWKNNIDRDEMSTVDLLKALHGMDEAPWAELVAGKPINARGLAARLGKYGVSSCNVIQGDKRPKGYKREHLYDAWSRYLPPLSEKSATSATPSDSASDSNENEVADVVADSGHVADVSATSSAAATKTLPGIARRSGQNGHVVADVAEVADSGGRGGRQGLGCAECGAVIPDDALYCDRHGATATGLDLVHCQRCGGDLPDDRDALCPRCGTDDEDAALGYMPMEGSI